MFWKLFKSETVTLTKAKALDLARKHAGLTPTPTERKLDKGRVKKLVGVIRNGKALPFNWATVEYGGVIYRENGMHSAEAIVEVGADLPDNLVFHLDQFKVQDKLGMVELFRQFDQRWSSRSLLDIAGAYAGLVPELAAMKGTTACKVIAEGISWYGNTVEGAGGSAAYPTGDAVYNILHNDTQKDFIAWAFKTINGRRELTRREIVAAMFGTYNVSQSSSEKFWSEVGFGKNFFAVDSMPGAVLINELEQAREDKDFKDKEFPQSAYYYRKAIKAWNAFCAGDQISSLRVAKKGWPEIAHPSSESDAA